MNETASASPDQAANGSGELIDFAFELGEREIRFVIDETLYPRDAVFGASYIFVDRCYVFLDRPADQRIAVRLRTKGTTSAPELEALAGEFANELLNQSMRMRIADSTQRIREYYMARAFFASEGKSTIDQLLAELDAEEMAEAPLEVAVPWAGKESAGKDAAKKEGTP